eukprot:349704-Chlamydomonas_euryale.AAC.2
MASQSYCYVCFSTELNLLHGVLVCSVCGTQADVSCIADWPGCAEHTHAHTDCMFCVHASVHACSHACIACAACMHGVKPRWGGACTQHS